MEKRILQGESPASRLEILKMNAESTELFTYPKQLSEEDLEAVKNEIVKTNIELAKLQEERKAFNEVYNEKKKPLDTSLKENLSMARTKVKEVTEQAFLMSDQDEGVMLYYNEDGILINKRPLFREERQLRIVDRSDNASNY